MKKIIFILLTALIANFASAQYMKTGHFALPHYTTSALPTPSASIKYELAVNDDTLTSSDSMRCVMICTGTSWISTSIYGTTGGGGGGLSSYQTATASGGGTTFFTGLSSNLNISMVWVNAMRLRPTTDYTITAGILSIPRVQNGDIVAIQY